MKQGLVLTNHLLFLLEKAGCINIGTSKMCPDKSYPYVFARHTLLPWELLSSTGSSVGGVKPTQWIFSDRISTLESSQNQHPGEL